MLGPFCAHSQQRSSNRHLFEEALDIERFRLEMKHTGDSRAAKPPAPEYLIAY